jgi:DHA3 family macrolide efflux protein-like MFS transporter
MWVRPFFALWIGEGLSLIGSQVAQFALIWWLTKKTGGSATMLAMATLVSTLPGICLGPIIGAFVDRWDRRKTMLVADGAVALAAAMLVLAFWVGRAEPWHLIPVLLIRGIGASFHWPAMVASTSLMVPAQHLPRIQGLNQMLGGIMSIVLPPIGALLLGLMPLHAILMIDVVTAAAACGILCFVRIPRPERVAAVASVPPTVWADAREGLRVIWDWPGLRLLLIMAALNNLFFGPMVSLLPVLTTNVFDGGPAQLAWLNSVSGVGIALGGLVIGIGGGFRRPVVTALCGLIGLGIGSALIGLSPRSAFWMALVGVFLADLMLPVVNGPLHATLQTTVPPGLQGRVFSVIGSLSAAVAPIGLLLAGPVADLLGIRSWYLMGGAVHFLMGCTGFLIPCVLRLVEDRGSGVGDWGLAVGRGVFPTPSSQPPTPGAERP